MGNCSKLYQSLGNIASLRVAIEAREPLENQLVEECKAKLLAEFSESSFCGVCPRDPLIRGPYGEAEIWLKPGAEPISVPPYSFTGERRQAHAELVDQAMAAGKLEPGRGPWNTPSFPVPKKRPGEYRLVQDLRPQNEATLKDGQPLPVINLLLQRQGKFRMWSVLDLVDGYHQMPMKKEHLHITCKSTPEGQCNGRCRSWG